MYAFWKYDTYPYLLGGVVNGELLSGGRVKVEGYGPGHTFAPIKLLPDAEGEALHKKMQALAVAHPCNCEHCAEAARIRRST